MSPYRNNTLRQRNMTAYGRYHNDKMFTNNVTEVCVLSRVEHSTELEEGGILVTFICHGEEYGVNDEAFRLLLIGKNVQSVSCSAKKCASYKIHPFPPTFTTVRSSCWRRRCWVHVLNSLESCTSSRQPCTYACLSSGHHELHLLQSKPDRTKRLVRQEGTE